MKKGLCWTCKYRSEPTAKEKKENRISLDFEEVKHKCGNPGPGYNRIVYRNRSASRCDRYKRETNHAAKT